MTGVIIWNNALHLGFKNVSSNLYQILQLLVSLIQIGNSYEKKFITIKS